MYKVQFHFFKAVPVQTTEEGEDEPSPKSEGWRKYKQIKDHFSDDEGDFDDGVDDEERFLDEDNSDKSVDEIELPAPHRRTPITKLLSSDADDSA